MKEDEIELELLLALRDMARRQADTAEILHLELGDLAKRLGTSEVEVRIVLKDLLLEGLAEPFANTLTDQPEDGHCRITQHGMAEIRRRR